MTITKEIARYTDNLGNVAAVELEYDPLGLVLIALHVANNTTQALLVKAVNTSSGRNQTFTYASGLNTISLFPTFPGTTLDITLDANNRPDGIDWFTSFPA